MIFDLNDFLTVFLSKLAIELLHDGRNVQDIFAHSPLSQVIRGNIDGGLEDQVVVASLKLLHDAGGLFLLIQEGFELILCDAAPDERLNVLDYFKVVDWGLSYAITTLRLAE